MPRDAFKAPAKRGRPSFKPPRPAGNKTSTAKPTLRRKSAPAATLDSSEDDSAISPERVPDPESESSDTVSQLAGIQDPPPVIPPDLLTRLLHHHLEKKPSGATKLGKDANALVGKYMETFVREAIARAAFERGLTEQETGTGDGFLEVRCP